MTSEQLYNLVRDVRRDAWPKGVVHERGHFWESPAGEYESIRSEHAALMFVGSMAAEVVKRGGEITGMPAQVTIEDKDGQLRNFAAPTLIAALAAALKEVDRV